MAKKISGNVKVVLGVLKDEIGGNIKSALKKLDPEYIMTWVYKSKKGVLFPRTKKSLEEELKEAYPIKGRKYDIKNIAESKNIVMVEMVESYPDPQTKKIYRTPIVIVLEMKKGKIRKGRHYCDPQLSYLYLTKEEVNKAFK